MRTIERTRQFKRDYKRETKGRHRATLDTDLLFVLTALAEDEPLAARPGTMPCPETGQGTGIVTSNQTLFCSIRNPMTGPYG